MVDKADILPSHWMAKMLLKSGFKSLSGLAIFFYVLHIAGLSPLFQTIMPVLSKAITLSF